jgi:glutathione synthase/RimK-type ligase-like ATP-grasp enzyme
MNSNANQCCVLNGGNGSWAFEPLAQQLSSALGVPVSAEPRRFNYLLCLDGVCDDFAHESFIPLPSVRAASDKRLTALAFACHDVSTPRTLLLDSFAEVIQFVSEHTEAEWCLKFPTGCGANGHRMITANSVTPSNWPRPFILQEFVRLERPEVYRLYCAGGQIFGWIARRFPAGRQSSPWVAHARGARYERLGQAPVEAVAAARAALEATCLFDSFGCVDLLRRPTGEWVVLEVGTDGLFNHVDRELDSPELEAELLQRIALAFWQKANSTSPV